MTDEQLTRLLKATKDNQLSKREQFAMAAMQGILANRELQIALYQDLGTSIYRGLDVNHENIIAYTAVKEADALIKQLENQ